MKYKHFIKKGTVQCSAHVSKRTERFKNINQNFFSTINCSFEGPFLRIKRTQKKKYYKSARDNSLFVFHLFPLPFGRRKIPTHLSLDLKLPRAPILPPLPFKTAYVI